MNLPLFVKSDGYTSSGRKKGVFQCECGRLFSADIYAVRCGNTKSCGCRRAKSTSERRFKHGDSHSREYNSWSHMKQRCLNPRNAKFNHYGGRGITVCERWLVYSNFLSDMGRCPSGLTLERKDVNGNYCPDNCIWADQKTQQNNRRNNITITEIQ